MDSPVVCTGCNVIQLTDFWEGYRGDQNRVFQDKNHFPKMLSLVAKSNSHFPNADMICNDHGVFQFLLTLPGLLEGVCQCFVDATCAMIMVGIILNVFRKIIFLFLGSTFMTLFR